ncbi:MAG: universal stress protein [Vicinamibacteraceae bacterium]
MVTFTQVLCPTDLSEASRPSLSHAAAVARRFGAALTVLHVVPPFDPIVVQSRQAGSSMPMLLPSIDDVTDAVRAFTEEALGGLDAEVVVQTGDPSRVIVDQAVVLAADLIVMGTHGRSGFERLLSGSIAGKVLRRAPCPVLTVPPHAPAVPAGGTPFRRLLCAVDFSDASEQALGFALELGAGTGGAVTVVTVLEWLAEEPVLAHPDFAVAPYRTHLAADAAARLRALVASATGPEPCAIDQVVALGRPYREILRMAAEKSSDLIVVGAHGRGAVGRALFGSTTQQIVRDAECPVLVVHAPLTP